MTKGPKTTLHVLAKDEISELVQERTTFADIDEIRQFLAENPQENFWEQLESIADQCDEFLTDQGLPSVGVPILYNQAREWIAFTGDPSLLRTGWTWTRGTFFVQEVTGDFSEAWYAARIGLKCRLALEHQRKGSGDKPLLFSMVWEIAQLVTDGRWRAQRKPQIITGRKQRATLKARRDSKNESAKLAVAKRRALVAGLMRETKLTKGALDNWLLAQLLRRFEISVSNRTIREDRKALSG